MTFRIALVATVLVGVTGAASVAAATSGGASGPLPDRTVFTVSDPPAVVTYSAPVSPVSVVRPFEPPPSPYGPGHRGVDLATTSGQRVRAAADGTVRFAGHVARRGVVVIAHADGITTEYEPLAASVRAGQAVARGDAIGAVDGIHGDCPPDGCLHWGAKRGDVYLDPMTLLRALGPVRLLPWSPAEDP